MVYERDSLQQANTRHGYGITLRRSVYQPLLHILSLDEASFRHKLAVDTALEGNGCVGPHQDKSLFRANRRRLEELLRGGLDIRWDHELAELKPSEDISKGVEVVFRSGPRVQSSVIAGADGPHSRVRTVVSPSSEFKILPYAVFNGKRRLSRDEFDARFAAHMQGANVIEQRIGEVLLQISLNDIDGDKASINYVYSRPAREGDPLFRPHRPNSGAKVVPKELFDEIDSLPGLAPPFSEIFSTKTMRKDRLLNWLMRSLLVPQADLEKAASRGTVLMGDATHHGPVLGSYGANEAITDALALADHLVEIGGQRLEDFPTARYNRWVSYMEESDRALATMHGQNDSPSRL